MSIYQTPEPPKRSVIPVIVITLGVVTVLCGAMLMLAMLKIRPTMPAPAPAAVDTYSAVPPASPSPSPSRVG